MRSSKRVVSVLISMLAMCAFGIVNAPAASAGAYGCPGGQINSYPIKTDAGTLYGNIYLYYDSSTGKNCAVAVKTAAGGYGTPNYVAVTLFRCKTSTPGAFCDWAGQPNDSDYGTFSYYAGPVELYAAGKCIHVHAQVSSEQPIASGSSPSYGVHCG
ncbi:hypothetical protein F0L17_09785 [Streptomyces sp. TRM43335]|uniref:Spore-associated protein A n=1 Tax=Streptomyces taklimakanensis TaxID=2569853 RepID=A0A6G2BBY2_9ACTN|nr:hypothetical protein [Streptomyces taklimakanensis]MTE19412.1 hypothetical protein [Streptomyces taklimakanensis]